MNFFTQKINGLRRRFQCFRYGIIYLRSNGFKIPPFIKVNGVRKDIRFSDRKSVPFIYEFSEICIEDCYNLRALGKSLGRVKYVVDIGANQGLFLLAARQVFSTAQIDCYEPNFNLEGLLSYNARALNATCYYEAVTRQDCKVTLDFTTNDLETVSKVSSDGNITGTALAKVIERCGGQIDIVKMDCEGAEWDLLDEKDLWKQVRGITMEYHLWAKPEVSLDVLKARLDEMGFDIMNTSQLSNSFGLLTAIRR